MHEVPGFLFIPTTQTELSTTIVVDESQERVTPFQLCAVAGTRFGLWAGESAVGKDDQSVPFRRWEQYNETEGVWETISEKPVISVSLSPGAEYRAVFGEGAVWTFVPRQQVCLELSSVHMIQQIPSTTTYTQPTFTVDPIQATILVGDVERVTPFRLCDEPGAQYVLIPQAIHWTAQEQRLEFWKWQRYNAETEEWEDLIYLLLGNVAPGQLNVSLREGGHLRAVYRYSTMLY
ncbi:MAG TPA: hypothetical protein ENN96_00745 [Candidatus Acetothermia bacterium]|nr:hypothetical protein [Candidatus Acetothermia bacterium]